jgi:hypothetical protein
MGIRRRQEAAATILGLLQVLFHSASKFMLPSLPLLISILQSSELVLMSLEFVLSSMHICYASTCHLL